MRNNAGWERMTEVLLYNTTELRWAGDSQRDLNLNNVRAIRANRLKFAMRNLMLRNAICKKKRLSSGTPRWFARIALRESGNPRESGRFARIGSRESICRKTLILIHSVRAIRTNRPNCESQCLFASDSCLNRPTCV